MLKELYKAKQVFYRHHYKFPNAVYMTKNAFTELKIETKELAKYNDKSVLIPRINGCVIYFNDELKTNFEYAYLEDLAPND